MKKTILTALLPIVMATSAAFGANLIAFDANPTGKGIDPSAVDPNAHINLFAHGTTNTSLSVAVGSTFSLDTSISFTGFTAKGLSYWLEAQTSLASHLTLVSESYQQSWGGNNGVSNNAFATSGAGTGTDSGFLRELPDLGSTSGTGGNVDHPLTAGTYQVSQLNFSLDNSIAPGTYTLQLTTLSPVISEISDNQSTPADHQVALATFTLTVVPEPATLSLLGLGGLGSLGMTMLRARRRK
jgi:hypothetical protein